MRRDRSNSVMFLQIFFGALLLGLFIGGVAFPQTSFFQGKTVTIIQSSAPGGVGDMRTKAIVPFLQKYIPGNPTIVMEYMDGGGGRKAANHLYKSVRPDGLTIGRMSTPFVMHPILGESGVLYDIDKVTYLGTSYSGGYHIFLTRREAGLDSREKLRAASGVRIGAQSVGHLIYISGRMFAYLIGLKQPKFVTGYNAPELDIAIEQGEIDGRTTVADSTAAREASMGRERSYGLPWYYRDPEGTKTQPSPLCRTLRHRELCQVGHGPETCCAVPVLRRQRKPVYPASRHA